MGKFRGACDAPCTKVEQQPTIALSFRTPSPRSHTLTLSALYPWSFPQQDAADDAGISHHSRVALLRGAVLGPGRWIRGEPPKRKTPPYLGGKGESEEWKKREAGVMSSDVVRGSGGLSQRVSSWTVASYDDGGGGRGGGGSVGSIMRAVAAQRPERNLERSEVSAESLETFLSSDVRGRRQEGEGWNVISRSVPLSKEATQHQQQQGKRNRPDENDLPARAPALDSAVISPSGRYSLVQNPRMTRAAEDYSLRYRPSFSTSTRLNSATAAKGVPPEAVTTAVGRSGKNTTRAGAATNGSSPPSGDRHRPLLGGALTDVFDGVVGPDLGSAGILSAAVVAVNRQGARCVMINGLSRRLAAAAGAAAFGMIATGGMVWRVERGRETDVTGASLCFVLPDIV